MSLAGVIGNLLGYVGDNGSLYGNDQAHANSILLRNEVYEFFEHCILKNAIGDVGEIPFL